MTMRTRAHAAMVRMRTSSSFLLAHTAPGRVSPCAGRRSLLRGASVLPLLLFFASTGFAAGVAAPGSDAKAGKDGKKHQHAAAVVRIAQGQVVNGAKKPLENAIVYLEDPTSLTIKSYLTDASGHFHFTQLAAQTDYEVWAEQNGTQSKHKFISQFSSHDHFDFQLTLDPNKKKKLLGFL